jgi:hypothetical protein
MALPIKNLQMSKALRGKGHVLRDGIDVRDRGSRHVTGDQRFPRCAVGCLITLSLRGCPVCCWTR